MREAVLQENKMGVMPLWRLLLNMALPLTVSLIIQALYNIIDSLFLSGLGENVLAAVSLAATVQNFMSSAAAGIGVGINALATACLGRKDRQGASQAAVNGLFIEAVCMLFFVLAGLFLTRAYFLFQTDNAEIVAYGTVYLQICMIGSVGIFGETVFERLLQATGKTVYSMITQGIGACINIGLDAVLIFGRCGFPALGIRGAAIATVCSQCIALALAFFLNKKKNSEITISLRGFRPNRKIAAEILRVGIPSTVMGSVSSFMFFLLNRLIASFSTTALAVFGIYNRFQQFMLTPMVGLNNSIVSIVAYNVGARDKERIMGTFRWGVLYGFAVMATASFCFLLFPEVIMSPFHPMEEMFRVGVPIFRIVGFTFLFSSPSMIACSLFQGLGEGFYSLFVSVARQILIRVPFAYFLAQFGNLSLVWFCWPISEICSDLISMIFFRRIYKRKIAVLAR